MPEQEESAAPEEEHMHWDMAEHDDCPQCVENRKRRSFRDDIQTKPVSDIETK